MRALHKTSQNVLKCGKKIMYMSFCRHKMKVTISLCFMMDLPMQMVPFIWVMHSIKSQRILSIVTGRCADFKRRLFLVGIVMVNLLSIKLNKCLERKSLTSSQLLKFVSFVVKWLLNKLIPSVRDLSVWAFWQSGMILI